MGGRLKPLPFSFLEHDPERLSVCQNEANEKTLPGLDQD